MRILLVDDEPNVRAAIRRHLRRHFVADIAEAYDGQAALECLLGHPPDLLIMDVRMPVLDGIGTLQAIRRSPRCRTLPVILLTGDGDERLVRQAQGLGVSAYLVKPVNAATLVARVGLALRAAGAGAS